MNFEDILFGIAIGDAFGAGVEFMDRDWIGTHVDFTCLINVRHLIPAPVNEPDIFTRNYTPWDYTDDTEMTIGVLNAFLSGQEFSCDLLIQHWLMEYQDGYNRKGFGRNGHGSMRWVFTRERTIEEVREFQKNTQYPGNAPVMRAIPLGFVPEQKINSYAVINADATHPHPKARAASILIARATEYLLLKNGDPEQVIIYCQKYIIGIDLETDETLLKIDKLPAPPFLDNADYEILCGTQPIQSPRFLPGIKGIPSDAMLTAGCILYILKHVQDTFSGLKTAIRMGGDVDSVASVCTGILAGRYGLDSLPAFMLKNIEGKKKLQALATDWKRYFSEQ